MLVLVQKLDIISIKGSSDILPLNSDNQLKKIRIAKHLAYSDSRFSRQLAYLRILVAVSPTVLSPCRSCGASQIIEIQKSGNKQGSCMQLCQLLQNCFFFSRHGQHNLRSAVNCRVTLSLHVGPGARRAHVSVTAVVCREDLNPI